MRIFRNFRCHIGWIFLLMGACETNVRLQNPTFFQFDNGNQYLAISLLDDDLVNIWYGEEPLAEQAIPQTVMLKERVQTRPSELMIHDHILETADMRLIIDKQTLEITITDKTKGNAMLTSFYPDFIEEGGKRALRAKASPDLLVYGLGQQFADTLSGQLNFRGKRRISGEMGNKLQHWEGGVNGNAQFPILYALDGPGHNNYAFFLDNTRKIDWDFTATDHWKVAMDGGELSFYVMTGADLPDLRRDYMELTGFPKIPPKNMFGLWISEYGYENWQELETEIQSLKADGFPLDGAVLDLQWFGGVEEGASKMGRLKWDTVNFPNAPAKIKELKQHYGIDLMHIEEPYVDNSTLSFLEYLDADLLVMDSLGACGDIFQEEWWGNGGMLDYTNPETGRYIFDNRRKQLIEAGLVGHWTDLGEPEIYYAAANYHGGKKHPEVHNIYNFQWIESIYEGYERHGIEQRPFIMSRSGIPGIQRFGAAMWSGDIGAKAKSLEAQMVNQVHMLFSGIDYYGADIGGFHRWLFDEGQDHGELYTRWFAYGMMFDIPGRPHALNLENQYETAPNKVGDVQANLNAARLRYDLVPYYYSLAYQAYTHAAPLFPPLVYYYQDDPQVSDIFHQKMIGPWLMSAAEETYGQEHVALYLPKGNWYDFHLGEKFESEGKWLLDFPLYANGHFQLPLLAKEGAIIPLSSGNDLLLHVDNSLTKDASGKEIMRAKVYPSSSPTSFTLYEDDGRTGNYEDGIFSTTHLQQQLTNGHWELVIAPSEGDYKPNTLREWELWVRMDQKPETVELNGLPLERQDLQSVSSKGCWNYDTNRKALVIRTDAMKKSVEKRIEVVLQNTL